MFIIIDIIIIAITNVIYLKNLKKLRLYSYIMQGLFQPMAFNMAVLSLKLAAFSIPVLSLNTITTSCKTETISFNYAIFTFNNSIFIFNLFIKTVNSGKT